MKKKQLMSLIRKLGVVAHQIQGNWIQVSCPLHNDDRPSAGFSINPEGKSIFHCFVCGTRSIESILNTYKWKKGVDLFEEYLQNEDFSEGGPALFDDPFLRKEELSIPVPQTILNNFEPVSEAAEYLKSRGISVELAEKHGLLFCREYTTPKGKTWKNAIVCPVRDMDFQTYWIHFRATNAKVFWHGKPEHFNCDINWGRNDSWFGIEFLDLTKPIFLVEGIFDCLRLKTLGIENVIAAHGGIGAKSKKVMRIIDCKPRILYLGFDADEAGEKFREVIRKAFNGPIINLDWARVGVKDPGDLKSEEDLIKVLETKQTYFKYNDRWREKI